MPPRRSDGDGPLASGFMLVLLIGVVAGGIWLSVKDRSIGNSRGPETQIDSGFASRSSSGGGKPGSPAFVEAFKRLPDDATAMQRTADAEFDRVAQALGADELAQVQKIMSRNGSSRDDYSDSDLATLRRHGLGKWVRAQAMRWSSEDPAFETAAGSVWKRSGRGRDDSEVTELAVRWGEMNRSARMKILDIIDAVEHKTRELTSGEREAISSFAGDDYLANRP